MKPIFNLILFSFLASKMWGQDVQGSLDCKMKASELMADDAHSSSILAICKKNNGEICLFKQVQQSKKAESSAYFVEVFDDQLKRKSSKQIEVPKVSGEETKFYSAYATSDHFTAFWWIYDKKAKKTQLFASDVDEKGFAEPLKKVCELVGELDFRVRRWFVYQSENETNWLIEKKETDEKKKTDNFSYEVFDAAFRSLWSQPMKPNYEAEEHWFTNRAISDAGQTVVLMRSDLDSKSKDAASFRQAFLICNRADGPKTVVVKSPENQILESANYLFSENAVEIVGTYESFEDKKTFFKGNTFPKGTYFIKINLADAKIEQSEFTPFSEEIYDFFRVKPKDRRERGLPGLAVQAAVHDATGVPIAILEWSFGSVYVSGNKEHNSITSASALLLPYPNGKAGKPIFVPKGVHSDDNYTGHGLAVAQTSAGIHLLFNDSPQNRGKKMEHDQDAEASELPSSTQNRLIKKAADAMLFSVATSGKTKSKKLFSYKDDDVFLNHVFTQKLDEQSFAFIVGNEEKYKLVKVEF